MPELILPGCVSRPLASYLKACGVLRLLAGQKDDSLRGYWRDGIFVLFGDVNADDVRTFFLEEYKPTPVVTPWNGGSGFYPGDATDGINGIAASDSPRLSLYRAVIQQIRQWPELLKLWGMSSKEAKDNRDAIRKACKETFLQRCRSTLPEDCLPWLDAAYALGDDKAFFAPLLGTGGNEGRLEYANTFMSHVVSLFLRSGPQKQSAWLDAALFGTPVSSLPLGKVGQFDPGSAGGINQGSGADSVKFEKTHGNPWDFLFMLEGALLFAAALVRRTPDDQGRLSSPFCSATPLAAGFASAGLRDKGRGEVWMPLWSHPASLRELRRLLSEGRVTLDGRQAKDGLEFARAASTLGVDRGIDSFERYSFLERRGQSYVALPSGHVSVEWRPRTELLAPLVRYLQMPVKGEEPASLAIARRRCTESVYACTQTPDPRHFIAVSQALARLDALPGLPNVLSRPCFPLDDDWITACDDGSPEVRLAAAMASISSRGKLGSLRAHLAPVEPSQPGKWADSSPQFVPWRGGVLEGLGRIVLRRIMEAQRLGEEPWRAAIYLDPADLLPILEGTIDLALLGDLTRTFSLVRFSLGQSLRWRHPLRSGKLPWVLGLLKLLHMHWPQGEYGGIDPTRLGCESRIAALLQAGRLAEVCEHVVRRLRVAGAVVYQPASYTETVRGLSAQAILACLLIPVRVKPLLRLYVEATQQT